MTKTLSFAVMHFTIAFTVASTRNSGRKVSSDRMMILL